MTSTTGTGGHFARETTPLAEVKSSSTGAAELANSAAPVEADFAKLSDSQGRQN